MMQRFALRSPQFAVDMVVFATGNLEGRPLLSWLTHSMSLEEVRAAPGPFVPV
jgi:hypothetical protein